MFEYSKKVLETKISDIENLLSRDVEERNNVDTKLYVVTSIAQVRMLSKFFSLTYLFGILLAFCVTVSIPVSILELGLIGGGYLSLMLPCVYYELKFRKKNPEFAKLSKSELKQLDGELRSKREELSSKINDYNKVIEKHNFLIECFEKVNSFNDVSNDISYAFINAKNEDEYIEMRKMEGLFHEEWDKFIHESLDYENINLKENRVDDEQVKTMTKKLSNRNFR